jgi:hypothetical protein
MLFKPPEHYNDYHIEYVIVETNIIKLEIICKLSKEKKNYTHSHIYLCDNVQVHFTFLILFCYALNYQSLPMLKIVPGSNQDSLVVCGSDLILTHSTEL